MTVEVLSTHVHDVTLVLCVSTHNGIRHVSVSLTHVNDITLAFCLFLYLGMCEARHYLCVGPALQ